MILTAALTMLADQFCKSKAEEKISENEYIQVVQGKLYITNVKNKGMAMGAFSENRRMVLLGSAGAMGAVALTWIDAAKPGRSSLYKTSVALIMGGGLSNVYDRVVKGRVTDYICVKKDKAPIFNLADAAVFLGLILSIIASFKKK